MTPYDASLNPEIGMAMWWLTHPRGGTQSGPEIIERLMARGFVHNREEARQVLRAARSNIAATGRAQMASGGQSLRSACDYKCPDDTPIALRLRFNLVDDQGNVLENRSVVVNARASDNLADVLNRARNLVNRLYRRGNTHYPAKYTIQGELSSANIDAALLNYTEGRWV